MVQLVLSLEVSILYLYTLPLCSHMTWVPAVILMLEPRSAVHEWPELPSFADQRVEVLLSFPPEAGFPACELSLLALLFNARLMGVTGGKGVTAGGVPPEAMKFTLLILLPTEIFPEAAFRITIPVNLQILKGYVLYATKPEIGEAVLLLAGIDNIFKIDIVDSASKSTIHISSNVFNIKNPVNSSILYPDVFEIDIGNQVAVCDIDSDR